MSEFEVLGPYDVPYEDNSAHRHISSDSGAALWRDHPEFAERRGCYVFAIRAGGGIRPVYVGKATKNYQQEVFTPHKLNKYAECLSNVNRGTPVLFFVAEVLRRGRPNAAQIDEIESYLIQEALKVNDRLLNEQKTAVEAWQIRGVIRSGRGAPSKAAQAFSDCLRIG